MSRTVLIVDDDVALRKLVSAQLQAAGCRVLEAGTAREGHGHLAAEWVDLVIVDGLLPDTRGVQWIASLREVGVTLPMVFISAYWRDLSTYRRLTDELGVALVLYKPFDAQRLAEKIVALLNDQPQAPLLPEPNGQNEEPPPLEQPVSEHDLDVDIEIASATDLSLEIDAVRIEQSAVSEIDLSDLVEEYLAALPGRVQELAQLVWGAEQQPSLLPEAISRAHRMRGSAGSYGYAELGRLAGEIEELLLDVHQEGESWASVLPSLQRALERMLASAPASEPPRPAISQVTSSVQGVLVVDEDAEFGALVARVMREQMLALTLVTSEHDALEAARPSGIAAAFVGMHVGGNQGLAITQALRERRPDLPIAVVSFEDSLAARLGALDAGANLFLTKPLSPQDLADGMRHLLSATRDRVLIVARDRRLLALVGSLRSEGVDARGLEHLDDLFLALSELRPDLLVVDEQALSVPLAEFMAALSLTPHLRELPILALSEQPAAIAPNQHVARVVRSAEPARLLEAIHRGLEEHAGRAPGLAAESVAERRARILSAEAHERG